MRRNVEAVDEPDQHRRISGNRKQERAEVAERLRTKQVDLRDHQVGRHLGVTRREVAVPEERHLLDQRPARAQHAIEPPVLRRADARLWIEHAVGHVGKIELGHARVKERIDRVLHAQAG